MKKNVPMILKVVMALIATSFVGWLGGPLLLHPTVESWFYIALIAGGGYIIYVEGTRTILYFVHKEWLRN
ncbi:hypothetical protein [Arthrobacter sp. RCC_34]|uniref:hypothetical protein n=1 Tax=Arthrobacter sp. RCC_34 TaxID=3239230 RepID=UPI003526156D